MAGSSSAVTSRETRDYGRVDKKWVEIVTVDWVADDADGTVPDLSLELRGYLLKAITIPGATNPTADYDLALGDPDDSDLDALGGALADRSASATEQVAPVLSGATHPVFLAGNYTLSLANNSANDATGKVIFYLADSV